MPVGSGASSSGPTRPRSDRTPSRSPVVSWLPALSGLRAPIKAALLDQHRIAGLGNLLADEVLWRVGIDPARAGGTLADDEVSRLHRTIRRVLPQLMARGGSHTGDLQVAREPGAVCPRDGTPLERRTIGGRTTYSCPAHQR